MYNAVKEVVAISKQNVSSQDVYRFIQDYIKKNGIPPSRRDIRAGVGLSSTSTVAFHLSKLAQMGRIQLVPGAARGIVIKEVSDDQT